MHARKCGINGFKILSQSKFTQLILTNKSSGEVMCALSSWNLKDSKGISSSLIQMRWNVQFSSKIKQWQDKDRGLLIKEYACLFQCNVVVCSVSASYKRKKEGEKSNGTGSVWILHFEEGNQSPDCRDFLFTQCYSWGDALKKYKAVCRFLQYYIELSVCFCLYICVFYFPFTQKRTGVFVHPPSMAQHYGSALYGSAVIALTGKS